MRLDGKVAIITGAAAGIGEACCDVFAAAGAAIVVADYDEAGAHMVARRLADKGASAVSIAVDVSDEQACADMVALAVKRFGGLDCAVNNAGIAHTPTPIQEIDVALWQRVWEVDALGVALCLKHEIPALLKRGGGSIVNIASGAGTHGARHMGAYVAAKHAAVGITRTAAIELAPHRIRVNAVCPGLIATARNNQNLPTGMKWSDLVSNPTGRLGEPHEVANMALWLASDRSTFVNGEAIAIDGGKYLS
ncbi:SDR family NAD(P)-dependent oxidoreductase [Sphingobium sp.]|uniref:SDR family NAD(P)-dependent oxidoreductase n=1 Tax=Sphingobium sp. TaxID=1912891 RepID=UPI002BC9CA34|nr:SDR family NAD(P)-dependent oxidoreductase [Sphingobium sp.]HUD92706.1 SDR family NAD(P)-dependent oxidoreductase [Sphingobium sp.]